MVRLNVIRVLARLGVALTTLAMLAVPTVAYVYVRDEVRVGAQVATSEPPSASTAQIAAYERFARSPTRAFVVLGYHDLVIAPPRSTGPGVRRLTVSTGTFAAHLRMLKLAGFESVSAIDVADFVQYGKPLPTKAVLVTFAAARARLWTHADPILARYGFRATVFVDPATVAPEPRGPMLSWPALREMAGTGRWSIGVAAPAETVPADAAGTRASALVTHRWLAEGRIETTAEFAERIHSGLDAATRKIAKQGVPAPLLYSYPFQPGYPLDRVGDAFGELVTTVDAAFPASVLTTAPDEAVGSTWVARRVLPRVEVYGPTTEQLLFARLRHATRA